MSNEERIVEEAAGWHLALASDEADWAGFTAWLERSPAHRMAYDRIAMLDADIDGAAERIAALLPANDSGDATVSPRRRWMIGALAASALMVAIGLPSLNREDRSDVRIYATGPGQAKSIRLADASLIELGPNSRIRVSESATTSVELSRGAAMFAVRHDPTRRFTVTAGSYEVRDIGTRFEMRRGGGQLVVAVAEGEVAFAREAANGTSLRAGERVIIDEAAGLARRAGIDRSEVGAWRNGQLIYHDAPLALIVADASRYAGTRLELAPGLEGRRFSGVIEIGDGSKLVGQIADITGLAAAPRSDRILLQPRP